ncbi:MULTISPECIES: GNAT family N-acetyltransferase [unclassified Variovorax]|uniref:bifunctional acetate--CoA ligase family protein/GNAT family N-acetyltransferase n=1 Tax=unclassified Variovorax TaxID=663243 RepID=UPI00076DC49D|nr:MULTISPECIES: GNAT family N-acetyltransferase [unclassified Variovorax]KWT94107.1 Protein acetyltransferase [Variovorax sp. WDL1]PNG59933.1 Succinyl-CoA ligase [ADP-forming] subunit alpha [Variovorax sp. B4]PNG60275.1 Succinyl-CoA ligase [ADP-forming] subunit alpha [Variovorax sp. B2]VTV13884.1 Succinyl-CoA ligase [ADP-forming] subunit alpha [Variovorax sp. WDL1]
MTIRHLDRLLSPASVAVFGASNRVGSVGAMVWRNLRAGRFSGPIYAVNPKHTALDGVPVFARAAHLPGAPDLALLCTPADTVPQLVAELGALGTRAVIIVTAGLSAAQKQAALDAARPYLMRLLGPNCIGLLSPHIGLNAGFAHTDALPGEVAFVSQSGALVTAMLDWAKSRGIGLSHLVSLGEHCDVDFGDLLDYLANDARTRSILLYVESIESPRKFMSAARAAARNKPVIIVKAGRAGNGVHAAASHTGALAGSDIVYDAAIRRAGMLRVDTMQDLFMAAETLARFRGNRSDAMTIMTNGGGAGVMAADAAAQAGITLAQPGSALLERLNYALPSNWSHANPIDIIGDAPVERYTATLSALLADESAGAVLFVHAPTAIVRSDDIARACLPLVRETGQRVMSAWLGDAAVAQARQLFEQAGVPDYRTPEEAVRAFAMLQTYRRNQEILMEAPSASENSAPDLAAAQRQLDAVLAEGREWLGEQEAKAVLKAFGVPVVPTLAVAASADALFAAARKVGYPVALKIVSRDITHKSDVGGVRLGLRDQASLDHAVSEMLRAVRTARPDARIDGFTVQPMVHRPHAQELIVGASIDSVFGPVILCGQGGTAVEVTADSAVALPPLNRSLARELVSRTRVSRLLAGYRDHPPARMDALYDVLIAVSQMLADLPQLAELDINPLYVDETGAIALDARIRVARQPVAGAERFAILPYPSQWARTLTWNGREITVRPIRPEDEAQHRRFLEQLDPEDIRMRIFQTRRELPRSELARLTQIDYDREMAFIAEAVDAQGVPETLGVARTVSDPDRVEAEFAIIVRSDLKGAGLGRLLFQQLIEHARTCGIGRLVGIVLRENSRMLNLCRDMGFQADPAEPPGSGVRRMVKALDGPVDNPGSGASAPPSA